MGGYLSMAGAATVNGTACTVMLLVAELGAFEKLGPEFGSLSLDTKALQRNFRLSFK